MKKLMSLAPLILLWTPQPAWSQAVIQKDGSATITVRLLPETVASVKARLEVVNSRRPATNKLELTKFLEQTANAPFASLARPVGGTNAPARGARAKPAGK